jgi:hypothetical protein
VKLKLTILNVSAILFLIGCIVFTIIRYPILSKGEGWGVVFMIGLFMYGATALVIDLVIQRIIRNRVYQNLVGGIVIIIYLLLLHFGI